MNVIVDTCIWSLALRRQSSETNIIIKRQIETLIRNNQVVMLGVIRQEILSGIRQDNPFLKLRDYLRAFSDFPVTIKDHENAAKLFNICRKNGIQGSNTDFLICAVAQANNFQIFTVDRDFEQFSNHIGIIKYDLTEP
ncbi:PIN domain-containing protein [Spirulina sp. CCNP1310]|uniref:type II toxin-antitoxin system VapC family toxin n=1 Tax=Spirulina sp. CCNP1310 TaxID=3110249 RepID=UPI002B203BD3|nr:PIN domain-containing protein [Spirulina sp. CCNP1310]MEA5418022.1 PIN domain-containing protein [Spirulina sp. CCNP1310]